MRLNELQVCSVSALKEGRSLGFSYPHGAEVREGFVVCRDGEIRAYRNFCPHLGIQLNWMPDHFLDFSGEYVVCAMHGALFNVNDGFCVFGPCIGRFLESLPFRVQEDRVVLILEERA